MRPRNPPLQRWATLIATVIATLIAKVIATLIATADNAILARLRRRGAETLAGAMGPTARWNRSRHSAIWGESIRESTRSAIRLRAPPLRPMAASKHSRPAAFRTPGSGAWPDAGKAEGRDPKSRD
jgi:hypothetical protein